MTRPDLSSLRLIAGVAGSFACNPLGQLLLLDMPEHYSLPALETAAACVANLFQTAHEALPDCGTIQLAFPSHILHARRFRSGVLGVLTDGQADPRALAVMTRLLGWRLSRDYLGQ
jgi:hypothetical protein